jgi:hypothetical protein
MKFLSRDQHITYVVVPATVETRAGRIFQTRPIRAKFLGGQFDSDDAAIASNWTDEEKDEVEVYLKTTMAYRNGLMTVVDENWEPTVPTATQRGDDSECRFTRRIGDDSVPCGKPVVEGTVFCEEHTKLLSSLEKPKTKKEAEPVPA